ncbi:DUF551 domain-containing protein [Ectopseudomonas hydrolytica]|uniref:DUF551 domain-containing protein n=1 Tax=Ectopseudomonas hydrolytica TaxID=2493633 RepID=UPI00376ED947
MSEWISVDDRLPEPNTPVLAYSKSWGVFFAFRKNRNVSPWLCLDGDACNTKITHWMPKPPPPQE